MGLLALEQHAEKTAAEGVVNLYNFCAGLSLIALGMLYFVMVRACVRACRPEGMFVRRLRFECGHHPRFT